MARQMDFAGSIHAEDKYCLSQKLEVVGGLHEGEKVKA